MQFSRRQFALLGAAAVQARAQGAPLTAGEVLQRIRKAVGVPWNEKTYRDTIKIGSADMPVTGIVSTFMSTLDILQRAAKSGKNMIISHEPTFWSDGDVTKGLENDPVYRFKTEFARANRLIVFRFHDHWHARRPDGIFTGWVRQLG